MLGNGQKLIHAKLGGSQKHNGDRLKSTATSKEIFSKLGRAQKLMHSKLIKLGIQQLTSEIVLGGQHPTIEIKSVLEGHRIVMEFITLGTQLIIILGTQLICGTAEQRFISGCKIGGKSISGPGQIIFGAINSGIRGNSGIRITNGTEGSGKTGPSQ
jgi:hypothetical protein